MMKVIVNGEAVLFGAYILGLGRGVVCRSLVVTEVSR